MVKRAAINVFIFEKKTDCCVKIMLLLQKTNAWLGMKGKQEDKTKKWFGLNSYQLLILGVLIAMLFFFSDSSIRKRIKYERQIKDLREQIDFYRAQTDTDKGKLNELRSNNDNLEKFARENYLMKKENEEIFIIE